MTSAPLLAVVDDDADVRVTLTRLVYSAGFAVETFASAAHFLRWIATHEADCLVLDLHMPEISGVEIQVTLAKTHRCLPIIVITGHDTPESRERVLGLGAAAYLTKPVDGETLLTAIRSAIGRTSR